ncbi:protein containing DUF322 [Candidatus Omnitrophus magneticus]|uniref:Protein containing DUF322 n=1 Tax=Candidatus Omnitrophus magneticus TaxID=1609969 RepID=A0A0F0CLL1_9BACT|nr:protein containing DUF322 [Candidatus Omnitrophus magneticus]
MSTIQSSSNIQICLHVVSGFFFIAGIITPLRVSAKLRKDKVITIQNPDGEVKVAISAVEEYVRKVAKTIPDIISMKSVIGYNRKGININARVTISAGTNIPEITERIQFEVKNKIQGMLGIDEKINIFMQVNKVVGDVPSVTSHQDIPHLSKRQTIPYREM